MGADSRVQTHGKGHMAAGRTRGHRKHPPTREPPQALGCRFSEESGFLDEQVGIGSERESSTNGK